MVGEAITKVIFTMHKNHPYMEIWEKFQALEFYNVKIAKL